MEDLISAKLIKTINDNRMIEKGDKILIGVSGGPDSIALLNMLYELRLKLCISVAIAHINHCIRADESDRDEDFVKTVADKLGIPCFSERINVPVLSKQMRTSIENAGRDARYSFFFKIAKKNCIDKIAMGHTADDQAETVIMRLVRGSGIRGIGGIPPMRAPNIIRPLINTKKVDILNYLKEKKIKYIFDSSNHDIIYTRNRIRHRLIPILYKYNPHIIDALNIVADSCRMDDDLLNNITEENIKSLIIKSEAGQSLELGLSPFLALHPSLQRRVIRRSIEILKDSLTQISFYHINAIINLIHRGVTGKYIKFPGGAAHIDYGIIRFTKALDKSCEYSYKLIIPGETVVPEAGIKISTSLLNGCEAVQIKKGNLIELFDLDVIPNELFVRNRRNGDIFYPSGMAGKKKIKKFFIDKKISVTERNKIPLIASGNNILWVAGYRRSSLGEVSMHTDKAVHITIETI